MTPLVTAIIPTYRRPSLLRRAMASVLAQEGAPLRLCVFDNASGDETGTVVQSIARSDERVAYHCHERNIGGAANFEYGMRSVATPCFSILSDDDYLLPGFYQRALDDLATHPQAMFWAGLTLNVDERGKIWDARVDRWPREGLFNPPDGLMCLLHGLAPVWTGIVFRKRVLEELGFPDWEVMGPSDLDFVVRAAAAYPFILRKHPSAVFTLNPQSFSATQPLSSFWPGWQKMFRNILANQHLDEHTRAAVLLGLNHDARRMLFRRGLNVIVNHRFDFAREAAGVLNSHYSAHFRSLGLRLLSGLCEWVPPLQRAYAMAYRAAESRIVGSRAALEDRFGSLIAKDT